MDSELIGQVKKVQRHTPILCSGYVAADISLGVLRRGVGSMSTQDVWVTVTEEAHRQLLVTAAESGALVKIRYDERRFTFCVPHLIVRDVSVVP